MIQFKRNDVQELEFTIQLQGADISSTKGRIILKESKDSMSGQIIECIIYDNGKCIAEVSNLQHIKTTNGHLSVEIIAENQFFQVYESEFLIQEPVSIKIDESSSKDFLTVKSKGKKLKPTVEVFMNESNSIETDFIKKKKEIKEILSKERFVPNKRIKTLEQIEKQENTIQESLFDDSESSIFKLPVF